MPHTPGPWRIGDACNTIFGPKTTAPSPAIVATLGRRGAEKRANAQLIAAAPELLVALKLAVEAAYHGVDDYSWEDAALAAIAKAEGR